MCLNLNIIFNHLPKAVLNHQRVLFNKSSKVLVKLYLLAMESVKGKYLPFTTKLYPSQKGFFQKAGAILYRLRQSIKKLFFCCVRAGAMQRYPTLKISPLFRMFSLVSNVLDLFSEAEVIVFLKYCFGAKLIDRLFGKKHYLMYLFLSGAENIRKLFVDFEDFS